jgi:hypothetical protein
MRGPKAAGWRLTAPSFTRHGKHPGRWARNEIGFGNLNRSVRNRRHSRERVSALEGRVKRLVKSVISGKGGGLNASGSTQSGAGGALGLGMHPSPSPQPSPVGRGRLALGRSTNRSVSDGPIRRGRFSLSPRERVGVRGNQALCSQAPRHDPEIVRLCKSSGRAGGFPR